MKSPLQNFFICLVLLIFTTSCGSTKTLHIWKDEGYDNRLHKVLVIAVAELNFMRDHFENVLSERLASQGIEALPSNKVFPQSAVKLEREDVIAKVRELGIDGVLVSRPINKEEFSRLTPGGVYLVPTDYYGGWYPFYAGSFAPVAVSGRAYDAEFFRIVTNFYDVRSEKLVWSYLAQVKVENSREGAINPFIDTLMKRLEDSKLL